MANGTAKNGANGHVPRKPSHSGLSLNEYSASPSLPPGDHCHRIRQIVPDEYVLPNGHPDDAQYTRLIMTSRVYEACSKTSLTPAINLSIRLGCNVLLKREDEQPVFSFKLRGAYNKMAHLDRRDSWKGVIACSAGNHAQGVAYSARLLQIPATIVMPANTPSIKHKNVSRLGSRIVLHGQDFDAAKEECSRLEKQHGLINIPPFDDPYVIAGQGTIGMELLQQANLSRIEAIFCCIGGGGLIAGIGIFIKRMAPHVKIIGVETEDANAMVRSLQEGKRVVLEEVGPFADGAAVKTVGKETFRICQEVVDEVVQVNTDETCAAIKDIFEDTRSIVEPAGALALAGLKKWLAAHPNPTGDGNRAVIAITSGANMNFDRLRFVAERATLGEGREALLRVNIPKRPGSFAELMSYIMPHAVTEFSYRFAGFAESEMASVLIGISLDGAASERAQQLQSLMNRITAADMEIKDLSGHEVAKSHYRYLVGGPSDVADERLYWFKFPERPGALEKFLNALRLKFNISLFHYRNGGSDVGKVLAGIQCPDAEVSDLENSLRDIGYPWTDWTKDDEFQAFLRR
ncbi:hypothetical protein N8I77_010651 [Diaporthe amygdali]|uniref:Threonine dehydratase n=1 Tax=Phomopsis amygdali TaxID=1214568 RepID=A0AAD9W220_PHOAM|nr:hypothetical protein N8I77_010651 [Diaporthe amygdali]